MPSTGPILLTSPPGSAPESLVAYREQGGYSALERAIGSQRPEDVISVVEESGLRGRGGAAFPLAKKLRLAASREGAKKFILANGGEHEPGSNKDKHLVEFYPHKVLEGLLLAGFATGAQQGYLYLIEDMAGPLSSAERAIAELREHGLLGGNIRESEFSFEIELHRAPPTYVAGEETAAIDAIEGGPGKPREKPPYPGESGINACPTTVSNVETLAHLPFILREGAKAYRQIGTEQSSGSMLFTLPDSLVNPGVFEVPFGTSYRELIEGIGGGTRSGRPLRGILPAMSCAFISAEHLDVAISHESLAELGSSPGCGGIQIIEEGQDIVAELGRIAEFFKREQCGQCPPCRMVTNQLAHIMQAIQAGQAPAYAGQIEKLADFGRGKGLCSLIQMALAPIRSAVQVFGADLAAASTASRPDS
ncbi:MAG: NADH-ubiquinone oxidoreductase-F iron-sulfur binding region domain-containing protein [Planctomycetota bacterium]|jgi:NADH-quinone oxidoreductase subunit F